MVVPNLPIAAPIPPRSAHVTLPRDFPPAAVDQMRGVLEEASEAAAGEPLAFIADAELAFPALGEALELARGVGFERCGLVVKTAPDAYGMIPLRIGGDAAAGGGEGELHVILQADGYRLTVGLPLAGEPDAAPPRATIPRKEEGGKLYKVSLWDTEALAAKAGELLARTPTRRVTVMADPSVRVDDLAVTLAALRGPECGAADDPGCRVAEVILAPKIASSPPGTIGTAKLDVGSIGHIGRGGGPAPGSAPAPMPTVEGQLDRDIVRRIVRAHMKEIRACFDAALARDSALSGRISVDFVIRGDGDVKSATIGEGDITDAALGACMTKAVKRWRFPKSRDGGEVQVSYPFELVSG
ncbi:MAG: AgmX/PglI C-terminal domain-containing protein [Myxococcales bacterium]|nr:AgmX/PglI C-terminal domain-containing protein [Myxococcales bacterium]